MCVWISFEFSSIVSIKKISWMMDCLDRRVEGGRYSKTIKSRQAVGTLRKTGQQFGNKDIYINLIEDFVRLRFIQLMLMKLPPVLHALGVNKQQRTNGASLLQSLHSPGHPDERIEVQVSVWKTSADKYNLKLWMWTGFGVQVAEYPVVYLNFYIQGLI